MAPVQLALGAALAVGGARAMCPYAHNPQCLSETHKECSLNPRCAHVGSGDCCPGEDGHMQACCGWAYASPPQSPFAHRKGMGMGMGAAAPAYTESEESSSYYGGGGEAPAPAPDHYGAATSSYYGSPAPAPNYYGGGDDEAAAAAAVSCGSHSADSCDACPQGNGATWCNGDCHWAFGGCVDMIPSSHAQAVVVNSKYSNMKGAVILQSEEAGYPQYLHEDGVTFYCHFSDTGQWYAQEGNCGSRTGYLWKALSQATDLASIDTAQGSTNADGPIIDSFDEVTWGAMDTKYNDDPWIDASFPPNDSILQITEEERPAMAGGVEWIRAMNLNRDGPDVIIDPENVGYGDPIQGAIGDCWFISAMSAATLTPQMGNAHFIMELFEPNPSGLKASPEGRYTVRLFDVRAGTRGEWVNIEVDDFLPCRPRGPYGNLGEPLFVRSPSTENDAKELWPQILEKAFAKFTGNYGALIGGQSVFAWQAFGICDDIMFVQKDHTQEGRVTVFHNDITRQRAAIAGTRTEPARRRAMGLVGLGEHWTYDELFDHLNGMHHVLGDADCCDVANSEQDYGLPGGHAYTIVMATSATAEDGTIFRLVRLRNPWANNMLYTGDWGRHSQLWEDYPEVRAQVVEAMTSHSGDTDLHATNDGVFWMAWEDFQRLYTQVELCDYARKYSEEHPEL